MEVILEETRAPQLGRQPCANPLILDLVYVQRLPFGPKTTDRVGRRLRRKHSDHTRSAAKRGLPCVVGRASHSDTHGSILWSLSSSFLASMPSTRLPRILSIMRSSSRIHWVLTNQVARTCLERASKTCHSWHSTL